MADCVEKVRRLRRSNFFRIMERSRNADGGGQFRRKGNGLEVRNGSKSHVRAMCVSVRIAPASGPLMRMSAGPIRGHKRKIKTRHGAIDSEVRH